MSRIDQEQRDRVRALYEQGVRTRRIAEQTGRTYCSVSQMLQTMGLEHRDAERGLLRTQDAEKSARREQYRVMWEAGKTQAEIAREIGVSPGAVAGMIQRMGLRGSRVAEVSVRPPKAREEASRLAVKERSRQSAAASGRNAVRLALDKSTRGVGPEAPSVPKLQAAPQDLKAQIVDFMGLKSNTCHWPLTCIDGCFPGGIYCGALKEPGDTTPYCRFHGDVARGKETEARVRQPRRLMLSSGA